MAGIGNHEFGYSESFWPSTDSGGECGVPYNFYFSYASQDLFSDFHDKKPWYSFDYGNVHVIQISSEHNITVGSDQYNFLEVSNCIYGFIFCFFSFSKRFVFEFAWPACSQGQCF
jgi:hypothetical protein